MFMCICALAEGSVCLCIKLRPPPHKKYKTSPAPLLNIAWDAVNIYSIFRLSPSLLLEHSGQKEKQNNRPRNLEPSAATWMVESGNLKLVVDCSKSAALFLPSRGFLAFLPPLAIIVMKDYSEWCRTTSRKGCPMVRKKGHLCRGE